MKLDLNRHEDRAALKSQKSALKNFRITKTYRQQTVPILKVRELLSFMTKRSGHPGRLRPIALSVIRPHFE